MSDTPQEVVSVPVSVLEKTITAIQGYQDTHPCVNPCCALDQALEAALSALRGVVRS